MKVIKFLHTKLDVLKSRLSLSVIQNRNFRLYVLSFSINSAGDIIAPIALAFALLDAGLSSYYLGLALAVNRAPVLLCMLLAGAMGDRLNKKHILIVSDMARAALQVATGFALVYTADSIGLILVLQFLLGIFTAINAPAQSAFLPSIVEKDQLKDANSVLGMLRSINQIVGITVAGILVALIGGGYALVLDGVSFFVSALLVMFIHVNAIAGQASNQSVLCSMKHGISYVGRHRWLSVIMVHNSLVNTLTIAPVMVLGPVLCNAYLNGATSWASIGVGSGMGALLGSYVAMRLSSTHTVKFMILISFAALPLLYLFAIESALPLLFMGALLYGFQLSLYTINLQVLVQSNIASDYLSRVFSMVQLSSRLFVPLGLWGTGLLTEWLAPSTILFSGASVMIFASAVLILLPFNVKAPLEHSASRN